MSFIRRIKHHNLTLKNQLKRFTGETIYYSHSIEKHEQVTDEQSLESTHQPV
ncbi:IS1 family transposase [Kistimonas asteriae]|uniref:IS1 family transposase n=1 Tax=Kistimonas asteriae TaxID=517724 RepID=UPI001BA6055F